MGKGRGGEGREERGGEWRGEERGGEGGGEEREGGGSDEGKGLREGLSYSIGISYTTLNVEIEPVVLNVHMGIHTCFTALQIK